MASPKTTSSSSPRPSSPGGVPTTSTKQPSAGASSSSAATPKSGSAERRKRLWALSDLRAILSGTSAEDPAIRDKKGLQASSAAALMAAESSDRLLPLLELLGPPQAEESQIAKLVDLVEAMAIALARVESKLDRLLQNGGAVAASPRK